MAIYDIKDLEGLSGVKAHSIRIWEKRYKLLNPVRTDTNIRRYSDEDLKKLLNVAILNKHGRKISKIAGLSSVALREEVIKLQSENVEFSVTLDRMVGAMLALDEEQFDRVVADVLKVADFEELVIDFMFPFLEKIGILWQTGSIKPAQEHFVSNILRNKIIVATDQLSEPMSHNHTNFLLFLREGELHEIGLLFCNYLLRKYGQHTAYLGQSVPLEDLSSVQQKYNAQYLVLSMINSNIEPKPTQYLHELVNKFPQCQVMVFGQLADDVAIKSNIRIFKSYPELIQFIKKLVLK